MPPVLQLRDIELTLGGQPLLSGAELAIAPGDRIALVGRNGSGKSTLLKIAAGELTADNGERYVHPKASLRFLAQEPDLGGFASVLDYVLAGLPALESEHRARAMLAELGVGEDQDPGSLSGGEARRAALVRVIAAEPDILLLDEPTNHLDLLAIEWLETTLQSLRSAVCVISHDRRLLSRLTRSTVWIDRGKTRMLDRGFSAFEAWRDKALEEEERDAHKLDRKIVDEEHWMRYGVTARRKRNMRRVGELADLRKERREGRRPSDALNMVAQEAKSSGALVIEAEGISKSWGDLEVVKDFSLRVMRGDRVGLIGANGAGKTTLLNLLTGGRAPDAGEVRIGARVNMVSLDQRRASLSPTTTLTDAITGGGSDWVEINGAKRHVAGYLKDFLFQPNQMRTAIGKLSGGERGRLMLARALTTPSNLLVLDEPTNDLDLETLDLLQELLSDYPGTVLLVTHDRDFLDRVVTSTIVSEGEGQWREYFGGYEDMVAQRGFGLVANGEAKQADKLKARGAPRAPPKKKMSFHQKHALETLPKRMEALHRELAALEAKLADASLHARDPNGFDRAMAQHSAKRAELEAAETEWLELELLREELANS
jgi:ATP-binding cassette subfamily F protein uup